MRFVTDASFGLEMELVTDYLICPFHNTNTSTSILAMSGIATQPLFDKLESKVSLTFDSVLLGIRHIGIFLLMSLFLLSTNR